MNRLKELLKTPLIWCFALFILGYTAWDLLTPDKEKSDMENRYLQQKPTLTLKNLFAKGDNAYNQRYEKYINDQFVLRDDWITLKSRAETALGKIENNGIAYGKDGYLFEKVVSVDEENLQKNIQYVQEFLQMYPQQKTTLCIIPNAYTVLTDKLPAGFENITVNQRDWINRIYQSQWPSNLSTLDITDALAEHSDEYIYYRTDHHWTTLGAYYAYAQLMQQLGQEPVALSELDGKTVENFYGTYFSKAKKFDAQADTITYYEIPDAGVTIDGKEQDGYYDFSKFEVRDKYAAFLRGNNGYTVIKSGVRTVEEGQEPSRILIIKDSYANSFAPFLLYNYDEVHVVDLRYLAGSLSQLINEGGFDEILLMYNFSNLVTDTNLYKLGY